MHTQFTIGQEAFVCGRLFDIPVKVTKISANGKRVTLASNSGTEYRFNVNEYGGTSEVGSRGNYDRNRLETDVDKIMKRTVREKAQSLAAQAINKVLDTNKVYSRYDKDSQRKVVQMMKTLLAEAEALVEAIPE